MRISFESRRGGERPRAAARDLVHVEAMIKTLSNCYSTEVLDILCAGVRVCGRHLPEVGDELELSIYPLHAFGTVIWREEDECGVRFDIPLGAPEVALLKQNACLTECDLGVCASVAPDTTRR
jgi:hypothetical protein